MKNSSFFLKKFSFFFEMDKINCGTSGDNIQKISKLRINLFSQSVFIPYDLHSGRNSLKLYFTLVRLDLPLVSRLLKIL